ncbi:uncharacterized protein LOC131314092 [Rhododendron vialii]|uniref:uncharacterized protein LOC131314092 n=1 Tax=Rhododendron vialii TaxID=182163 RepID=UPI00265EB1F5|nr:uncharacterized protein LOC131314092 [Rhododendron vialii]
MSSRGSSNGGGVGIQAAIPSPSRKMVQSLREIVNCPEPEIYAMLSECNMDPNEAVSRLLSQDPFHEVKSKREKKKENKDTTESRSRGISNTSSRWGKGGTDRYDGRSSSTQYNYSDSGALHGRPAYKKENGTNNYASPSFVASAVAGNNTSQQPSAHRLVSNLLLRFVVVFTLKQVVEAYEYDIQMCLLRKVTISVRIVPYGTPNSLASINNFVFWIVKDNGLTVIGCVKYCKTHATIKENCSSRSALALVVLSSWYNLLPGSICNFCNFFSNCPNVGCTWQMFHWRISSHDMPKSYDNINELQCLFSSLHLWFSCSNIVTTEYKASTVGTSDGMSSLLSSGYQPSWSGVPGQVSMADIVKMGRPHGKASGTTNTSHYGVNEPHSNGSRCNLRSSEDYLSEPGVGNGQHVSPTDEWPLVEQPPTASVPLVLGAPVASQLHADVTYFSSNSIDQRPEPDRDEFEEVEDGDFENTSAISRKIEEDNSGGASLFNRDIYDNIGSYQPLTSGFERQEVDNGISVSSVRSNMQQLSLQEDLGAPSEEDTPSVIIPSHLQIQSADCSHLSFGSFGSGPFSSRLKSNRDDSSGDVDTPAVGRLDTRTPEYYGDDSLKTGSDGNLVHRTGANVGIYESPSTSQSDMLKPENTEAPQEIQFSFPSSSSAYDFENGPQLNAPFPHSQTRPQMQNLAPFPSAYTNSLPSSLLAASAVPARDLDLTYSPFPMAQSLNAKYGSTPSSISGSTISVAEALKTVGFASTPQTTPAQGPALPQHLAAHPYSQPTLPLGPFANMIGYPFMPQNYTYVPPGFQQAFAENSTYHQSLAAVLPQYRNSISVSSLPQSNAIASGYGSVGNSTSIPGNFSVNLPAAPGPTSIGYDDSMSSQYKDNNYMLSLQQNENSGMWVHGSGSRTVSSVPASAYFSLQGQNQQPSGYRQTQQEPSQNYGAHSYPNFYYSNSGISLDHQQQNPRDGLLGSSQGQPSKQSQQMWQNGY